MVEKKLTIQEAIKQSIASLEQEGFVFTEEELAELERIASGEITTEEYRQNFLKKFFEKKTNS